MIDYAFFLRHCSDVTLATLLPCHAIIISFAAALLMMPLPVADADIPLLLPRQHAA